MPLRPQYEDTLFAAAVAPRPQPPCIPVADAVRDACSALCGPDPSDPTDRSDPSIFRAIVRVLVNHVGADAAIAAPDIADRSGLFEQLARTNRGTAVRRILSVNLEALPWPLCGDSDGYYFAATAAELTHYAARLRSHEIEMFRRDRTTRRAAVRTGWFEHLGRGRFIDRCSASYPSHLSDPSDKSDPSDRTRRRPL